MLFSDPAGAFLELILFASVFWMVFQVYGSQRQQHFSHWSKVGGAMK
jgi:hypothetical protein